MIDNVNGDVAASVRDVLDGLAQRPTHDPSTGRFVAGNPGSMKTLDRSEAFWEAVACAKADLVTRVRRDNATGAQTAETLLGLIDAYAEARLLRHAMFLRLTELGGPVTSKGKARALYSAYLAAMGQETKLATAIGLTVRTKDTLDLARSFQESGR